MSDGPGGGLVGHARDAAARGDWQHAFDLLMGADADDLLTPADLPLLGEVAYAAGYLDVTVEAWERTHRACIQAGDPGTDRHDLSGPSGAVTEEQVDGGVVDEDALSTNWP